MNILLWVIFGGLAGWVATLILGQDSQVGIVWNIIIGVVGAFLGGWIMEKLSGVDKPGVGAERPTSLASFGVAVIGAVILLLIVNLIF